MRLRLSVILAAAALTVPVLGAAAAPTAPTAPHPARHTAGTYTNPLDLQLPGGGTAESCADPFVLRPTAGDTRWTLYCTADALTSSETDSTGALVIHQVPQYRSADLVHWTYAGDAFPTKPSWLAPSAGVWAPDVVYRDGQYRMYYTASGTTAGGSAIGLATSSSPTGPWTDTGTPVVPPGVNPDNGQPRWEFDPEVISANGTDYLYFGSYNGGIFVRQLSADGRTSIASSEQRIAIDNRYEGTYIVQHDGWYYFFGSATNCCNGSLTGYSVFAARSRSPLGPFVDKDGVPITASRVGGTPVLSQNGNRWVGTGHNAVITDYSGQDWIVYHAVDRTDPYYSGGTNPTYTKRPALMDPLDWQNGWPVVRGDRGPSDSLMPAPAAQPGETTAYRPSFVQQDRPGATIAALSDSFDGSSLSKRWSWIRQPAAGTYSVTGGALAWQTQAADLQPPDNSSASVLTEAAPKGDYVVETKVSVSTGVNDVHNYVQGGLIIYRSDGDYVRLTSNSIWNTRQTEFGKHVSTAAAGQPSYGNGVVGPVGDWTYLRIVKHTASGQEAYTAYTSLDGTNWDKGITWTASLGSSARIGLISLGGSGFTSTFQYVTVSRPAQ
jgi:arabinan endo-1,5-alpha-L-arabinosidase